MSGRPSENSRLSSAMKDRYWSKTFAMRCGQPARTLPTNQTAEHDMQCICICNAMLRQGCCNKIQHIDRFGPAMWKRVA